jgi:hypothetical protein
MESYMGVAMLIEVTFLSFLLALWLAWQGLRGLFRMLPVASRNASPMRFAANQREGNRNRRAA